MREQFYNDSRYLEPSVLEECYNNLPVYFKEALVIREGEVEIGGWKQFLSHYGDKKLKYYTTQLQAAKDAFTLIFFDNRFAVEKIATLKKHIEQLSKLDESWVSVSVNEGRGGSTNSSKYNESATDSTKATDTRKNKGLQLSSDSNSSGLITTKEGGEFDLPVSSEETLPTGLGGITYPVNTVGGSTTEESELSSVENTHIRLHSNSVDNHFTNESVNKYHNQSQNIRSYLYLKLPELRRDFWGKFNRLFLF